MISVIIPVYNIEDYIEPCVKSILNSTYNDIEVIIVDDGSTDKSGIICDNLQALDHRIKVIHTKNCGVSVARNIGLDCAEGDAIAFIDGDDVIHPTMLETLKNALESGNYDFSMIDFLIVEKEDLKAILDKSIPNSEINIIELTQESFMRGLLDKSMGQKYVFSTNKLYKRELIEDMRFKVTAIEDLEWNCRVCLRMEKAVFVNQKLYYWVQRATSQMHQGIGERYINRVKSFLLCYQDIPQEKSEFRVRWLERIYKAMLYTPHEAKMRDKELYKRSKSICKTIYDETKKDFIKCNLRWSKKIALLLCYHFPILYSFIRAIL